MSSSLNIKKKFSRCTSAQIKHIIEYMDSHRDFANGEFGGPMGQRSNIQKWEEIREMLKEFGPNRSVDQWRTTWRDLKKRAREEGAKIRRARAETGNKPVPELSAQTLKILEIIGKESATGLESLPETGCGEPLFLVSTEPTASTSQPFNHLTQSFIVQYPTPSSSHVQAIPSSPTPLVESLNNFTQSSTPSSNTLDQSITHPTQIGLISQNPTQSTPSHVLTPDRHQHPRTPSPQRPRLPERTRTAQQRRRLPRPNDFLMEERETRNVLRNISNQLEERNNLLRHQNTLLERLVEVFCRGNVNRENPEEPI